MVDSSKRLEIGRPRNGFASTVRCLFIFHANTNELQILPALSSPRMAQLCICRILVEGSWVPGTVTPKGGATGDISTNGVIESNGAFVYYK